MPLRVRKFIGTVALFMLVCVWALVAMALAQVPSIHDHAVASVAYYVIAGLGWVAPAMPLVYWMSRRQTAGLPLKLPRGGGTGSRLPWLHRKEARARSAAADTRH